MFNTQKVVAVDCGRATVKYVDDYKLPLTFKSLYHPIDLSRILSMPSLINKNPLIVSYNDETYAVGDFALYFQDSVASMVDEEFINQSVLYYLVAIAMCTAPGEEIVLGLNLTFNTYRYKDQLRDKLQGKHNIGIYDFDKNKWIRKEFIIGKVGVVHQGWSGLVAIVLDRKKQLKPEFKEYLGQEGLILDVGRRTIDIIVIRNMSPVDGATYDYGTYTVYNEVASALRRKYSLNKPIYDIEDRHIRRAPIHLPTGGIVDVAPLVEQHAQVVAKRTLENLKEYLYQQTPDYVYIVGGGSYLFANIFRDYFVNLKTVEYAEFLNVMGMYIFFAG